MIKVYRDGMRRRKFCWMPWKGKILESNFVDERTANYTMQDHFAVTGYYSIWLGWRWQEYWVSQGEWLNVPRMEQVDLFSDRWIGPPP